MRFLFTAIMLLMPFIFLLTLESILTITNYGGNLKLVKSNKNDDRLGDMGGPVGRSDGLSQLAAACDRSIRGSNLLDIGRVATGDGQ